MSTQLWGIDFSEAGLGSFFNFLLWCQVNENSTVNWNRINRLCSYGYYHCSFVGRLVLDTQKLQ